VEVGQQHNRHSDDPQLIQAAPNQGRVRPGVHHHRLPICHAEHQAVTLAE
jgi:hypothetical protein